MEEEPLNGARDMQVAAGSNLAAIAKGLATGGNRKVTIREMSNLNHLFQTAPTGSPNEYNSIEETFAPAGLQVIGDWVQTQQILIERK